MKIRMFILSFIVISLLCVLFLPRISFAVTDTINVSLTVTNGGTVVPPTNCNPICNPGPPDYDYDVLTISNVIVHSEQSQAEISWDTNLIATAVLVWGKTPAFELGSINLPVPGLHQIAMITGLEKNTLYYFQIRATEYTLHAVPLPRKATYTNNFRTPADDRTPPSNALWFTATYNPRTDQIDLAWNNPTDPDFDVVKIMRSTVFYPLNPNDGEFVYYGSDEQTIDPNIVGDTCYNYTLFARDRAGNYSSGLIARACVPGERKPPPIIEISTSTDPLIENINLAYFRIVQDGRITPFTDGVTVEIDGNRPFSIEVDYDRMPEILKTILVTINKPSDHRQSFSFLMRVNEGKTMYTATVGPLIAGGIYPVEITIVDFKNQGIKRLNGALSVVNYRIVTVPAVARGTLTHLTWGGTLLGFAGIVSALFVEVLNVGSLYDLYLVLMRFIGWLLGLIGFRKKSKPWGVVYDAVTKRPLDPAYVVVTKTSVDNKTGLIGSPQEVADAITDLDGRYGFLLPKGIYRMTANKTHYSFPSITISGRKKDELYNDLYFGEEIQTKEGEIISKNIPLDPIGFDWNEFIKNKKGLFRLFTRREKIKNYIFNTLYIIGFISASVAFLVTPNLFNTVMLSSYIFLLGLRFFFKYRHRAISISDTRTGEPISFAIVRFFLPDLNQEVRAVVSDERGRFYALVSPGKYYVTIETKEQDGSYRKAYQSLSQYLERGVLSDNIEIDQKKVGVQARSWI